MIDSKELQNNIDTYFERLTHKSLSRYNFEELYNKIFKDLSNLFLFYYKDFDASNSIEISIDYRENKLYISGYIKAPPYYFPLDYVYQK